MCENEHNSSYSTVDNAHNATTSTLSEVLDDRQVADEDLNVSAGETDQSLPDDRRAEPEPEKSLAIVKAFARVQSVMTFKGEFHYEPVIGLYLVSHPDGITPETIYQYDLHWGGDKFVKQIQNDDSSFGKLMRDTRGDQESRYSGMQKEESIYATELLKEMMRQTSFLATRAQGKQGEVQSSILEFEDDEAQFVRGLDSAVEMLLPSYHHRVPRLLYLPVQSNVDATLAGQSSWEVRMVTGPKTKELIHSILEVSHERLDCLHFDLTELLKSTHEDSKIENVREEWKKAVSSAILEETRSRRWTSQWDEACRENGFNLVMAPSIDDEVGAEWARRQESWGLCNKTAWIRKSKFTA